ncbi:hypothetical protein BGZ46_007124 [Entomortierella lignicola]|nr:hypothetical protein BGZ46_007124 [Entomortierella lignicola]
MADSTQNTPFTPSKLVRTRTPVPDVFHSTFVFKEASLKGATNANTLLNKNLTLESPLCRDIIPSSQSYDSESDNEDDDEMQDSSNKDEERQQEGRERSDSILDLDCPSSSSTNLVSRSPPGSPRALAMQTDKKSKRIRLDASATIVKKTVRFDESKNTEHPHYSDDNRFSHILSSTFSSATRPVVSALSRRRSNTSSSNPTSFFNPSSFSFTSCNDNNNNNNNTENPNESSNQFSLSLENTSQEVMDFASSLSRLMGVASADSSEGSNFLSPSFSFGSPTSSPMRSLSPGFQKSPPSPVRPAFMSAYSPPMASSLSSFWSPTLESDDDQVMESSSQQLSPPNPVSKGPKKFTPRRPRISSPMRSMQQQQSSSQSGAPKPRFPSMLKREASNASFLDNYPSSLVDEDSLDLDEPSTSQIPMVPPFQVTVTPPVFQNSGEPDHAAIASAVLNMPSLTKSASDLSNSKTTSFQFDTTSLLKRSSSWDFGQTASNNNNNNSNSNNNAGDASTPAPFSFTSLFFKDGSQTELNQSTLPESQLPN